MSDFTLVVGNHAIKTSKELLCEYSDYFKAMFSGNYIENNKNELTLDVVDPGAMIIIMEYMENGCIDLAEYSMSVIKTLAKVADFLQINELIRQIEYILELEISVSNWIEIKSIAENSSYSKLEQLAGAYGLLNFTTMKPEYIPSIYELYWYLSHPYLNIDNELDVFTFGLEWISNMELGADAILVILSCLDLQRITDSDLTKMRELMQSYENSLAEKVIDLLNYVFHKGMFMDITKIREHKLDLCQLFTEGVYLEVINLFTDNKSRLLELTPVAPVFNDPRSELTHHYMYSYNNNRFTKWIEVVENNLWGWSVTSWGPTRLVVVCGEHRKGTGKFMRDVLIYDTLKKEWTHHGNQLPPIRHGGVTIAGDNLYIVGGVGEFRITLDSCIVYDLKRRAYTKSKFPDCIQSPAICSLDNTIYVAGHKNIYKFVDGEREYWQNVVTTDIRIGIMTSFKKYIYCMQHYFVQVYRFKPGQDVKLNIITYLNNPPASICNMGNRLIIFTTGLCDTIILSIEEYYGTDGEIPQIVWSQAEGDITFYSVAGSCALLLSTPPIKVNIPDHHKRYLSRYINTFS